MHVGKLLKEHKLLYFYNGTLKQRAMSKVFIQKRNILHNETYFSSSDLFTHIPFCFLSSKKKKKTTTYIHTRANAFDLSGIKANYLYAHLKYGYAAALGWLSCFSI